MSREDFSRFRRAVARLNSAQDRVDIAIAASLFTRSMVRPGSGDEVRLKLGSHPES